MDMFFLFKSQVPCDEEAGFRQQSLAVQLLTSASAHPGHRAGLDATSTRHKISMAMICCHCHLNCSCKLPNCL